MKKFFALFFSILALQLHASEQPLTFTDVDLGIELQIPNNLSKSFEITYTPAGSKLHVYNSDLMDPDHFYALVIGKLCLAELEELDIENFPSMIASLLSETLGEDFIDDTNDIDFEISKVERKLHVDVEHIGYRLRVTDPDPELTLSMELTFFYTNEHGLFVITATNDEKKLEILSRRVS